MKNSSSIDTSIGNIERGLVGGSINGSKFCKRVYPPMMTTTASGKHSLKKEEQQTSSSTQILNDLVSQQQSNKLCGAKRTFLYSESQDKKNSRGDHHEADFEEKIIQSQDEEDEEQIIQGDRDHPEVEDQGGIGQML